MKLPSRVEEIILLSIWRLKDNAYGITICEEVEELTGKKWNIGAIYAPLSRLGEKGYVVSVKGEPTSARGGRSKIFYRLTEEGKEALRALHEVHSVVWKTIPPFVLKEKG